MKRQNYTLKVDKRLEMGASNEFKRYVQGIEMGREVVGYLNSRYKWVCPSCGVEVKQKELNIEGRCSECGDILEGY